jgi:hypothetical protein
MRGFIAGVLIVLGLIIVPLANLGVWTQREVLSTDAFSSLSNEVLQEQAVRDALANRIADELVKKVPELGLGRFLLVPALSQAIATPEFQQIFEGAVSDMHAQLERGDDQLTLNLDAILPLVKQLVAKVDSGLAARIPTQTGLAAITVVKKDNVPQLWLGLDITRGASWAFPIAALVLLGLGIAVATNRGLALLLAGLGLAAIALFMVVALKVGREPLSNVAGRDVDVNAFDAGYDVVTESLVLQTAVLGLIGLVAALGGIVLMVARKRTSNQPAPWA